MKIERDRIGPELAIDLYSSKTGMEGYLVIDNLQIGPAIGGIRMVPDVTLYETFLLARSMRWKLGFLGLPFTGAKVGIRRNPHTINSEEKEEVLASFATLIRSYIESSTLILGPDMGTDEQDHEKMMNAIGLPTRSGLLAKKKGQLCLDGYLTALGVVISAQVALEKMKQDVSGKLFLIEGFGKVGKAAAFILDQMGAIIIAVSTKFGGIFDPDGLEIKSIIDLHEQFGDKFVENFDTGNIIPCEKLFELQADVLIPGARTNVIHSENQRKINVQVISSAANAPITDEAEILLTKRGVKVIPDFVSNSGAVIAGLVDVCLQGKEEDAISAVKKLISSRTKEALEGSQIQGVTPTKFARSVAEKRILSWLEDNPVTMQDALEKARSLLTEVGNH